LIKFCSNLEYKVVNMASIHTHKISRSDCTSQAEYKKEDETLDEKSASGIVARSL